MKNVLLQWAIKLNNERKRRRNRRLLVQVLSVVVVFCTTYALILPAVTMERETICGLEAHTHGETCYTQQTVHTLQCPSMEGDAVVHTHDTLCYDESGGLLCTLTEKKEHTHEDACYVTEQTLTCTEAESETHAHGDICYTASETKLVCDKEELVLHSHADACYVVSEDPAVAPALICTEAVVVAHNHAETCLTAETVNALTCAAVEHGHTDECYLTETEAVPPVMEEEAPAATPHQDEAAPPVADEQPAETEQPTATPEVTPAVTEQPAVTPEVTPVVTEQPADEAQTIVGVGDAPAVNTDPVETEQQRANYEGFVAEREALAAQQLSEEERTAAAEALWARICDASAKGELSEAMYYELSASMITLLYGENHEVGETADRSNFPITMQQIREEIAEAEANKAPEPTPTPDIDLSDLLSADSGEAPMLFASRAEDNAQQIVEYGGENFSTDGAVWVSKTIAPTAMENVFDITLDVITKEEVNEVYEEPDMAVVIVMDISNTMVAKFGDTTRYKAAIDAAENFINQFAANNKGASQLGFVAFNTNAHQIFGLQNCSTSAQATTLINTMKTGTSNIINASGYASSHDRFTNIEGGLKRAQDMLDASGNEHKYIVFLSDGFPTTYLSSGYNGYDPYDASGTRFYDSVEKYNGRNRPCSAGTSYSDIAAQRASTMAAGIKNSGTTIFSIGVDVNGQSVETYVNNFAGSSFTVVDRRTTNYEVYTAGQDSGLSKFETWLKKDIGSGYFYQSSDASGLASAFDTIFQEIKNMNAASAHLDWVTGDPMGNMGVHEMDAVEFLGFYDKDGNLINSIVDGVLVSELVGTSGDGWNYENSAKFDNSTNTIQWDLKKSRYISTMVDNITLYECQLKYRVRLKNEEANFEELFDYATNDETSLTYRVIEVVNGVTTVSEQRKVLYPIPEVEGYVEELSFTKVDSQGQPLAGAEFTLTHDTDSCGLCCGDNLRSVAIPNQVQTSGADGVVTFVKVPSGHKYTLTETVVPDGHQPNGYTYTVEVAYDVLTVSVLDENGETVVWTGSIENFTEYILPNTGGAGTSLFTFGGVLLIASAGVYTCIIWHKRRKGGG